jgi:hypothetical protein
VLRLTTTKRTIRFPERIDEMISDIQNLLRIGSFSEALIYVLSDWEKFRYLSEKERLLELARIRFVVLSNEKTRTKAT